MRLQALQIQQQSRNTQRANTSDSNSKDEDVHHRRSPILHLSSLPPLPLPLSRLHAHPFPTQKVLPCLSSIVVLLSASWSLPLIAFCPPRPFPRLPLWRGSPPSLPLPVHFLHFCRSCLRAFRLFLPFAPHPHHLPLHLLLVRLPSPCRTLSVCMIVCWLMLNVHMMQAWFISNLRPHIIQSTIMAVVAAVEIPRKRSLMPQMTGIVIGNACLILNDLLRSHNFRYFDPRQFRCWSSFFVFSLWVLFVRLLVGYFFWFSSVNYCVLDFDCWNQVACCFIRLAGLTIFNLSSFVLLSLRLFSALALVFHSVTLSLRFRSFFSCISVSVVHKMKMWSSGF